MDHKYFLQLAIEQAKKALDLQEVPVGAIIVHNKIIIGSGFNQKEQLKSPTAHAEIIAIKQASENRKDWRLTDCILYSTLEPCPMCAGAILQARIPTIVYGALDKRWGGCGTVVNLLDTNLFNHNVNSIYLKNNECEQLLKNFFKALRQS
ncbi:tRNA-specific adenosine deaminase [Candidatus Marinamargulisbacteria bacterium SCGC AG-410-N11]|nr:tRNA-specific adenosine deaminase [Candidatus Marinamargulisbacteria bacterium SCGC AG-410-N11]